MVMTLQQPFIENRLWYSFCPREWKQGTFRSLVQRAYIICSSLHLLKEELK